ncbi:MAG TPA: bifunctional phosphopantothenoylcysteine decarboxylase/phosphopantothenate--cysteine ligase CoaBC, partial [Desulfobacterales bacterium]|nr:bifunctional phosphopantothenoylcysteine decarboxylase/phosphopantothenate--cysteine ligase CoaBC [Desulfobacterales bacterium]
MAGRKILVGICGSVAAYKVADWVRAMGREGGRPTVVMTRAATRFLPPLTVAALTGEPVHIDMFAGGDAHRLPHIALGQEADAILVAPATAQTIARLTHGLADDLLAATVLASRRPVVLCPAMNPNMYTHPATQANLARLREYGYRLVAPAEGRMACGAEGPGRLASWGEARFALLQSLAAQDLAGKRILITAGPTREPLDPVRFLTNRSSGRMGYALAAAAAVRGGEVVLVSGPVSLSPPPAVRTVQVTTAQEMADEVLRLAPEMDCIVKAAAVGDFRFAFSLDRKLKKRDAPANLALLPNPDILAELGALKKRGELRALLVGFAAESGDHVEEGRRKLAEKHLDLI